MGLAVAVEESPPVGTASARGTADGKNPAQLHIQKPQEPWEHSISRVMQDLYH